jgi:hypothetical protein
MSTIIQRDFAFQAGVYFEGKFLMTCYDMSLVMSVETDSIKEQNIAMDRIKYFLNECLEYSIFVQDSEKAMIEKYQAADLKVCTVPEAPYDQIISVLILQKLNAITEGRLIISDITFVSELSDGVAFLYDLDTVNETSPFRSGWWTEANTKISNMNPNKKEKIVRLSKVKNDWSFIGLDWGQKTSKTTEIIFTSETEKP